MIKKNKQGKVVEFEDETSMSRVNGSPKSTPPTTSASEKLPITEAEAQAEFDATVKAAEEESATELKSITEALMTEISQVESQSSAAKARARQIRKQQFASAAQRKIDLEDVADKQWSAEMHKIWISYGQAMAPITHKMETAKAKATATVASVKADALEVFKHRMSDIRRAAETAAKLAVVEEVVSPPAG